MRTKKERLLVEDEINQILNKRHKDSGFSFDIPINLKKFNQTELMYFYRLVRYHLKTYES